MYLRFTGPSLFSRTNRIDCNLSDAVFASGPRRQNHPWPRSKQKYPFRCSRHHFNATSVVDCLAEKEVVRRRAN